MTFPERGCGVFTDEDLKRLKGDLCLLNTDENKIHEADIKALLARLEAAERAVDNAKNHIDFKFLDAWRKSCGQ